MQTGALSRGSASRTALVLILALAAVVALRLGVVRPDSTRVAASPISPDWSYTFQPAPGAEEKEITAALGPDGSVAIAGGAGTGLAKLVRLSTAGQEVWSRASAGELLFCMGFTAAGDQLYAVDAVSLIADSDSVDQTLVALNAAEGSLLWQRPGVGSVGLPAGADSFVIDQQDTLFKVYSASDGSITASVSPTDTEEPWLRVSRSGSPSRVVATTRKTVEVYSPTGSMIWRQVSTPDPDNDFGIIAQSGFDASGTIVTLETKWSTPQTRRIRLWSSSGALTATVPLTDRPAGITLDDVAQILTIEATGVTLVRESWWVQSTETPQERYTAYSSTGQLLWQQTINNTQMSGGLTDAGNGRVFRALKSDPPGQYSTLQLIDSSTGALLTERTVTGLPEADIHDVAVAADGRLFVLFSEGNTVTRFTLQP